jgi:hypothetical protein
MYRFTSRLGFERAIVALAPLVVLATASVARADPPPAGVAQAPEPEPEPEPAIPPSPPAIAAPPPLPPLVLPPAPRDYDEPDPNRNGLTYVHAVANVALLNWAIWQYDWIISHVDVYRVTGRDISANIRHGFTFDNDSLAANFFGHPYGGGQYMGAARSAGLGFWGSVPYVLVSSALFEYVSEWQFPSTNDVIATSLGGIAFGEMLFRLSSLALDDSSRGVRRFAHELVAAGILPARGATRFLGGQSWADGPPPIRKRARIAGHFGADQIRGGTVVTHSTEFSPSALIAVDADYGDLLPAEPKTTIPAYDWFDFYGGGIIQGAKLNGVEFESIGLLHGWNQDITVGDRATRDNHVPGFVQSLDYQGNDLLRYTGFGLGFGDILALRNGTRKRLLLQVDASWAPLVAAASPVIPFVPTDSGPRDYNLATGGSVGLLMRWDLGRLGQLGLRAREYGTTVIDGTRGAEIIGHARAWYEVDIMPNIVGLGVGSRFIHRLGNYSFGRRYQADQLSFQAYLVARL